jgi:hypothetical protein
LAADPNDHAVANSSPNAMRTASLRTNDAGMGIGIGKSLVQRMAAAESLWRFVARGQPHADTACMPFHGRGRTVYLVANKADGAPVAPAGRSQEDAHA